MEDHTKYTILSIGVYLFMMLLAIIYFVFFESDPIFQFTEALGALS